MASYGGPSIDSTMGAMFLGVVLSMACWGAEIVQLYFYSNNYTNDTWFIKLLVYVVCGLDVAHQSLSLSSIYKYLVSHYDQPSFLNQSIPEVNYVVILNGLIILLVQGFFLSRIFRLSKCKFIILVILGSLVLGQFVTSTVYYCKTYMINTLSQRDDEYGLVIANTVTSATADVAICGTLVYLLQMSRTGFQMNERMIFRLTVFTMQTTLATAICGVCGAATAIIRPHTLIYLTFYRLTGRMYINALLATLNNRQQHTDNALNDDLEELSDIMGKLDSSSAGRRFRIHEQRNPLAKGQILNIRVDREHEMIRDEDSILKIRRGEEREHIDGIDAFPMKSRSLEAVLP